MTHLGGYTPGGDPATYYPALWKWLVDKQGVQSVIDVGCGEGHAVEFFRELGIAVLGVDGVPQDDEDIVAHDFTLGPWPNIKVGPVDLVWSCEFVEHIEERYMENFLAAFKLADLVLMTHAEPGQLGYHHVNCRPRDYWVGAMAAIGYKHDEILTRDSRTLAAANSDPYNHFVRSGLAFRRYE